jgi:hypothetical protein
MKGVAEGVNMDAMVGEADDMKGVAEGVNMDAMVGEADDMKGVAEEVTMDVMEGVAEEVTMDVMDGEANVAEDTPLPRCRRFMQFVPDSTRPRAHSAGTHLPALSTLYTITLSLNSFRPVGIQGPYEVMSKIVNFLSYVYNTCEVFNDGVNGLEPVGNSFPTKTSLFFDTAMNL